MRFSELPARLRILSIVQAAAAGIAAYWSWHLPGASDAWLLAFLMICGALAGACKVDVNVRLGRITLGFTVAYFSLLSLGTPAAMLVGACGTVAGMIFNLKEEQRRLSLAKAVSCQTLYNLTNCVLATGVMGWVYYQLGGRQGPMQLQAMALPVLASAFCYYLVNTGGVTLAIGWSQGISPFDVFKNHFAWSWSGFLASASISAGLLWIFQTTQPGPSTLLFLPFAYLVYSFYHLRSEKPRRELAYEREQNRLNDAIIASLAMAIDAKDRHTHKHVNRVREYAVRLGQRLGVTPIELQAIRIASLLHDVGKIGIPERILCKPGKLTAEEFEIMKSHVELGAAILDQVQLPWPVSPIVRTHHERWDGLGYPAGLQGEAIPIGARILSLVDVFDALTSDRPYRRAIERDQAIQILRAGSGTQFDATVVETFIDMLPEMDSALRDLELEVESDTGSLFQSVLETVTLPEPAAACDEMEDAQVVGELTELLVSERQMAAFAVNLARKVEKLVPFTTFALFLVDRDRVALVPAHASGLWAELFDGMEIRIGEGISGYVASTGEPVLNAMASLDLARRIRPDQNLELNSTLCVPLFLNNQVIGTLTAYHSSYNFYQAYHLQRLERVARFIVEAVEQAPWLEAGMPLPDVDPVTNLPNHHALRQFLQAQLALSQTMENELAVVLLSVDVSADARQGSQREGALLALVSSILRLTLRDGDYVARYSADEFAVVLPRCGNREAARITRRLLERLRSSAEAPVPAVQTALAVGFYPRDAASAQGLLQSAERRLAEQRKHRLTQAANGPSTDAPRAIERSESSPAPRS